MHCPGVLKAIGSNAVKAAGLARCLFLCSNKRRQKRWHMHFSYDQSFPGSAPVACSPADGYNDLTSGGRGGPGRRDRGRCLHHPSQYPAKGQWRAGSSCAQADLLSRSQADLALLMGSSLRLAKAEVWWWPQSFQTPHFFLYFSTTAILTFKSPVQSRLKFKLEVIWGLFWILAILHTCYLCKLYKCCKIRRHISEKFWCH